METKNLDELLEMAQQLELAISEYRDASSSDNMNLSEAHRKISEAVTLLSR